MSLNRVFGNLYFEANKNASNKLCFFLNTILSPSEPNFNNICDVTGPLLPEAIARGVVCHHESPDLCRRLDVDPEAASLVPARGRQYAGSDCELRKA